jgi:crotonobetaine/carnitine-CoA ligase
MEPNEVYSTLISHRAQATPDAVFAEEINGRSATYADLDARGRQWAGLLQSLGIGPGDRVLTMLPTGLHTFEVWAGCASLRAMEVPINIQYLGELLEYQINDAQASVIIIAERWLPRLQDIAARCAHLETVIIHGADAPEPDLPFQVLGADAALADAPDPGHLEPPQPHDIAAIVYTSGTTGPSKGVLVPWAQLHSTAVGAGSPEELDKDEVLYLPFPSYHISARSPAYQMLLCGGRVVIKETFATDEFWPDIRAYGCTFAILIFTMAQFIWNLPAQPNDADNPLRGLLMVPPLPNVDEFAARYDITVRTMFNMTEVSIPISTGWAIDDPASCGTAREGFECRLVDGNDMEVAPGTIGELLVRADEPWVLNAGYWNKPEQTAAAWRNGWFHTGDAFICDEAGRFYFVDRFKDAIRRRGENISSMEVEGVVNSHPAVAESAAIGVPSNVGEDDVMCFVVKSGDSEVGPAELVEYLNERLPRFMVPRYLDFVDELPKTPTAKIRKIDLRARGITDTTWDRNAAR